MLLQVSSFVIHSENVLFPLDIFFKRGSSPNTFSTFEFAVTLVESSPEDVFIKLTATSIPGVALLSIAVQITL